MAFRSIAVLTLVTASSVGPATTYPSITAWSCQGRRHRPVEKAWVEGGHVGGVEWHEHPAIGAIRCSIHWTATAATFKLSRRRRVKLASTRRGSSGRQPLPRHLLSYTEVVASWGEALHRLCSFSVPHAPRWAKPLTSPASNIRAKGPTFMHPPNSFANVLKVSVLQAFMF